MPLATKGLHQPTLSLVTSAAMVATANMAYAPRRTVKWLERLVLVLLLQGKLWERCRNTRNAFERKAFQSYGDGAWVFLPVSKNRG